MFWFSLQLLSEIFLILRRAQGDSIINVLHRSSRNCTLFFLDFNKNWTFSTFFRKKYSNIWFHKNLSSGNWGLPRGQTETEAVRQIDITKPIFVFRNFTNSRERDKNEISKGKVTTLRHCSPLSASPSKFSPFFLNTLNLLHFIYWNTWWLLSWILNQTVVKHRCQINRARAKHVYSTISVYVAKYPVIVGVFRDTIKQTASIIPAAQVFTLYLVITPVIV